VGNHRLIEEKTFLDKAEDLIPEMASQTATKDDLKRTERKGSRNRTVAICVVALLCFFSILFNILNSERITDNATVTAINTGAIDQLNKARADLLASGVPEDQLPPPVSIDAEAPVDVDALVQAATATVLAQIRTNPDYRGAAGIPGPAGPQGDSPACLFTPGSCRGQDGANGQAGQAGLPGSQGDPGLPGQNGVKGNAGVQGDKGEKGDKGDPGEVGPAGPAGPKGDPGTDGADGKCPGGANMITVTAASGPGGLDTVTFLACPA
jgi:hypothetical protein